MKSIRKGFITPSSALAIKPRQSRYYEYMGKAPLVGDVVFGTVMRIGQHTSLENVHGRIHAIHRGTKAIFVYGNRYAPDYYEGLVPDEMMEDVDLVALDGVRVHARDAFIQHFQGLGILIMHLPHELGTPLQVVHRDARVADPVVGAE